MDLHWVAGVAVLLILAAISAYRDALKNEPIGHFGWANGDLPKMEEIE
ncbi:hypothetical protein [Trinickia terrae]|nr:hypothetical protein [Trinickia terrae]